MWSDYSSHYIIRSPEICSGFGMDYCSFLCNFHVWDIQMGNSGLIVISKCTRLMCFLFFSTYATIYSTRNELMTWLMFKTALLHSHTFQTMLKLLQIPKESVCCPSCSSFASCCTGCQCGPFLVFLYYLLWIGCRAFKHPSCLYARANVCFVRKWFP